MELRRTTTYSRARERALIITKKNMEFSTILSYCLIDCHIIDSKSMWVFLWSIGGF